MNVRIVTLGHEHFVDYEVGKDGWKNHSVRLNYDDAARDVLLLKYPLLQGADTVKTPVCSAGSTPTSA